MYDIPTFSRTNKGKTNQTFKFSIYTYLGYYSKFHYACEGLVGGIGRDEIHVPIPLIKILELSPIVFFNTSKIDPLYMQYVGSQCD